MRASSLEELLAEAAQGLLAMLVANPEAVRPLQTRTITISTDPDGAHYLLFDWLNELLYAFETEKLLLKEFEIEWQISGPSHQGPPNLTATCRGEIMDHTRHHMDHEVKAITYHGLRVEKSSDNWHAEVIVDI